MCMSWADYSRAAQGYIIRTAKQFEGVRKIAYYSLVAQFGNKAPREKSLFSIITDPPPPKIDRATAPTPQELEAIRLRYFGDKTGKAWQLLKKV